tara:strand:+ start:2154 stop:2657 length:504 start_codon:yes stop_codon:yes gene_type:complete
MKAIFLLFVSLLFVPISFSQTIEDFRKSANKKFENSDYKGAIVDYTKAIELDPNMAVLYFNRAISREELKDYQGAVYDYSQAIELSPDLPFVYLSRGELKLQLEDYRGAIADFTKEIESDSNSFKSYYLRGLTKIIINKRDSGCLDLSRAGELGYSEAYDAIKDYCN